MSTHHDFLGRAVRRVPSPLLALLCAIAAAPALLLPWLPALAGR
jgi:hypothetical protein